VFINFWYPALTSAELGEQPVRVRMLGLDFVLARDDTGKAYCLSNTCSHRGGSLAGGRLRDGCIECPYHGWRFDSLGHCVGIPSLGTQARVPGRTRVDSYPVEERYGIVFAFLGDLPEGERSGIMPIPEYGREAWRANLMTFDGRINFERSVENALDPAHTQFVHGFGSIDAQREIKLQSFEWGALFMTEFFKTPGLPAATVPSAGTGFHGASQFYTLIRVPPTSEINQYMFELPIDENHIRIFLVNMRNTNISPEHDAKMIRACSKVVLEDIHVLEDLNPVLTPTRPGREFLVAADGPIVNYRKWLENWEQRGWRIDADRMRAQRCTTAWAIPSPARRDGGSWVLDPVPMVVPRPAA
jgi:phenylpropionate dioxygenase-like ring-hydroxylating dioxygenase large terminal subunit